MLWPHLLNSNFLLMNIQCVEPPLILPSLMLKPANRPQLVIHQLYLHVVGDNTAQQLS